MTFVAKPKVHHPKLRVNEIGLTRRDYEGSVSTLCAGCGHDAVSAAIVQACADLAIPPHKFAKISGIGCSSKTPSYFLGNSHGFNSVHGRMPSVGTGANLANRELYCIGVSGDGVEQDDYVTDRGIKLAQQRLGFRLEPAAKIRCDQFTFNGVRLPYFKFPQNPEG